MLIKNIFPQINKKAAPFNKDKIAANSETLLPPVSLDPAVSVVK